jgi:hypothetical protein
LNIVLVVPRTLNSIFNNTLGQIGTDDFDNFDNLGPDDQEIVTTVVNNAVETFINDINPVLVAAAMNEDSVVLERVERLEEMFTKVNDIDVKTNVAPGLFGNSQQVSIIGAGLNAVVSDDADSNTVELKIVTSTEDVTIPGKFNSDNARRMNITLTNTVNAGEPTEEVISLTELDVPVKITVPVPEGMTAGNIVILHYHDDGEHEVGGERYDEIVPINNVNNGTISFTVARFSEFVFVEANTDGTFSVSGSVRSWNPRNQVTLQLVRQTGATPVTVSTSNHVHTINGGDVVYTTTIDAATTGSGQHIQDFTFPSVAEGTYTLVVTKPVHTPFIIHNIEVNDDVVMAQHPRSAINTITLLCGDIDGDGQIGPDDFTILRAAANYMRSVSNAANPLADLDGDGQIGPDDFTILRSSVNYMKGTVTDDWLVN